MGSLLNFTPGGKQDNGKRTWAIVSSNGHIAAFDFSESTNHYLKRLYSNWPTLADEVEAMLARARDQPRAKALEQRLIGGARLVEVGAVMPDWSLCQPLSYVGEAARVRGNAIVPCFGQPELLWCSCLDFQCGSYRKLFGKTHPQYNLRGAPILAGGQVLCADIAAYWLLNLAQD